MTFSSANAAYNAGQYYSGMGEDLAAIEAYSKALEMDRLHAKARLARGMAKQRIGNHAAAILDYDDVIRLFPTWPGLFLAYYSRAQSMQGSGDIESVIADCTRALELNSGCLEARYLRATALRSLNQNSEALEDLNAILARDVECYNAYYVRAAIAHEREKWQDAIDDFSSFLRYAPANSDHVASCYFLRGVALHHLGMDEQAVHDLTTAIKLQPSNASIYFRRWQAYEAMGNLERARKDLAMGKLLLARQKRKDPPSA